MQIEIFPALVAGLVATVVMSALMAASRAMNLTEMPAMPLFIGGMMAPDPGRAKAVGAVIHYLVMGTLVFGLLYVWLFSLLDSASWVTGGLIGLAHGVLVGMMMPLMSSMHPRIGTGVGNQTDQSGDASRLEFSDPGWFGVGWGRMTPMGLVVGHVVYGVVFALMYSVLV